MAELQRRVHGLPHRRLITVAMSLASAIAPRRARRLNRGRAWLSAPRGAARPLVVAPRPARPAVSRGAAETHRAESNQAGSSSRRSSVVAPVVTQPRRRQPSAAGSWRRRARCRGRESPCGGQHAQRRSERRRGDRRSTAELETLLARLRTDNLNVRRAAADQLVALEDSDVPAIRSPRSGAAGPSTRRARRDVARHPCRHRWSRRRRLRPAPGAGQRDAALT